MEEKLYHTTNELHLLILGNIIPSGTKSNQLVPKAYNLSMQLLMLIKWWLSFWKNSLQQYWWYSSSGIWKSGHNTLILNSVYSIVPFINTLPTTWFMYLTHLMSSSIDLKAVFTSAMKTLRLKILIKCHHYTKSEIWPLGINVGETLCGLHHKILPRANIRKKEKTI